MSSTYLTRAFSSSTATTKATWSFWVKFSAINTGVSGTGSMFFQARNSSSSNNYRTYIRYEENGTLDFICYNATGTKIGEYYTSRVFRDPNAWYHICYSLDTTLNTASDRLKLYVNGVRVTNFYTGSYTAIGQNETVNTTSSVFTDISRNGGSAGYYFNGILSHYILTDGYVYQADTFGSTDATTGAWKINPSPTISNWGTNGFWILKDGNSVTDSSPNSNNFTVGGGTLTDTKDCPSNVFATWNPLQATTAATYDFSAGNTRMAVNDAAVFSLGATLAATTGKYYMEMKWVQQGGNGSWGMIPIDTNINNRPRNAGVGWNQGDNAPWLLGSIVSGSWGGSIGTNDIIQLAMDLDNGAFYFGKNDVWLNSGNPTSGSSKTGAVDFSGTSLFGEQLTFAIGKGASGTDGWNANFGNGYFEQTAVADNSTATASTPGVFNYAVPTGYQPLSTKGLNA